MLDDVLGIAPRDYGEFFPGGFGDENLAARSAGKHGTQERTGLTHERGWVRERVIEQHEEALSGCRSKRVSGRWVMSRGEHASTGEQAAACK